MSCAASPASPAARSTASRSPRRGRCRRSAARNGDQRALWLANLTAEPQRVTLDGIAGGRAARLGLASFLAAADDPDLLTSPEARLNRDALELGPYEVVHIAA